MPALESRFEVVGEVWRYPGKGGWHFVSLPPDLSRRIRSTSGGLNQGWGSLPAAVEMGRSRWRTSLFPDAKRGCYLLPIKASARKQESIEEGDVVTLVVEILPPP